MFAQSRGHSIHYRESGTGDPLVLIPGLAMNASRWFEVGVVSKFADHFRILAIDLLGHGESDKPHDPESYTAEGLVADVTAVLDAAVVQAAHLWGYSLGGQLAWTMACMEPDRVLSLTVGGTAIRSSPPPPPLAELSRGMAAVLKNGDWDGFWSKLGIPLSDEAKRRFVERNDPVALAALIQGSLINPPQLDPGRFEGRKLVYAGSMEPLLALIKSSAESVGARFQVIEGTDHESTFLTIDSVAPLVREHLMHAAADA